MVDEAGVELDELRTGIEFGLGVRGGHDATDTDDRDLTAQVAVKSCDDFCRTCGEGSTGEPARLGCVVTAFDFRSGNRGVGGNEALQPAIEDYPGKPGNLYYPPFPGRTGIRCGQ